MRTPVLAAIVVCAAAAHPAFASDRTMLAAAGRAPVVARATALASGSSPLSVQRAYDVARDMREALRAALPVTRACRRYAVWAARFADASAEIANGFDRLSSARVASARRGAGAARGKMRAARAACRPGTSPIVPVVRTLRAPRPGAAFFGEVVAVRPARADTARLVVDGVVTGPMRLRADGTAWARLAASPGRHDLEVRFERGGARISRAVSRRVWLLPANARRTVRRPVVDAIVQRRLQAAAGRFDAVAGIWVHDLATGRAGSWNAGARFPAASTVKLGVMVEALRRAGARPDRSRRAADVAAIGGWSSNLAPNRLLATIGGPAAAQAALRRLGAAHSTYPGNYIVATAVPPIGVVAQPALVTRRVTTAADIGRAITMIHRAAQAERRALRSTRLTVPQARLLLGDLLASQPVGDNRGIVRQAFPAGAPVAQKHGWISSARNSVAVAYTRSGPVVVVVLTAGRAIDRGRAAALGSDVVRAILRP